MDVYDISNITDVKEDVVKKWTIRQRTKASTCRTLYKILECEMSVLGAKLPFLEGNQIKCIALNWIGIPTIMGHIPNSETIGYLIPAENKKKVMTMIRLLFSRRKASKKEEKLLNELSEMILKSCTSLISLKNSSSCNRDAMLGAGTIESISSNSNMMLTPINRCEEQINPLPEEHNLETAGTAVFQKPENKLDRKRRLFWGPGCLLSEKRRRNRINNSNLSNSVLSEDFLQMLSDEMVEVETEAVTSGGTTDSENIIAGTPAKSLSPAVSKSKNTLPVNLSCEKPSSETEEPCSDSDVAQQNLVSDPTENNVLENSALSVAQETSNENTSERNAAADASVPVNEENMKAIADVGKTNKIVPDECYGFSHAKATDIQETRTMASNETRETESENEEVPLVQHRRLKNTGTLRGANTAVSSENQIFQNEQSDLLTEPQENVPSKISNNDVSNCDKNMLPREFCRSNKAKNVKVSATVPLLVEKESSLMTTSDTSEVNIPDSCAATSPTPSSKELGHHSPIQYLSLEPYSSEEESEEKESPDNTVCQREETAVENQNSGDLLVDLFSPVTSDTNPRTLMPAQAPGDGTILSLDTFLNEQEAAQASK